MRIGLAMDKRVRRPSYIRTVIGGAICAFAIVKFAIHLDHPNYIGFAFFLIVGLLLIVTGLTRRYMRRDWINDEYARQLAADDTLRRSNTKARLYYLVGMGFIILALVWIYYGTKRFGPNQLDFTLEIAAGIAAPGLLLTIYRAVVIGIGRFRAIQRAHQRLARENHNSES